MPVAPAKTRVNPISRACLQCREKHLKCNGRTPTCDRCASTGLACTFVESRRGRRALFGSRAALKTATNSSNPQPFAKSVTGIQTPPESQQAQRWPLPDLQAPLEAGSQMTVFETETHDGARSSDEDDDHLIDLYYRYIHPAHPFLLPRRFYKRNRHVFPRHLRRAMCFIASHHSAIPPGRYSDACDVRSLQETACDLFTVQSLILVTLALHARFERQQGGRALKAAVDIAYAISLNSETADEQHEPLFQESWRRTWWELYTISGLISLISGVNGRLSQPTSILLPCDCDAYEACLATPSGNVVDIKERFRAEATASWSSFAYKVEAMRILASVLDANSDDDPSISEAAEASVSSYLLSLPLGKRDGLRADGEVDEVISCALMIIHLAGICLHLPRSSLACEGVFSTICGNDLRHALSDSPELHRAAALRSAKAISRLLTMHPTLSTLSPCFSCAVAFSATVQLSEYSTQTSPRSQYLRESLRLQLSGLSVLGQSWHVALVVRNQIARFAGDVMAQQPRGINSIIQDLPDLGPPPSLEDEQWFSDLISADNMFRE